MKLNTTHIKEIEALIKAQHLKFNDFEAEMIDHVCTAMEQSDIDESDFDYEINRIVYSFDGHFEEVKGVLQSGKYYTGMRAVEQRHFAESQRQTFRLYFDSLKRQIFTWRAVIWLPLLAFLFTLNYPHQWASFKTFSEGSIQGFLLATAFFILAFILSNDTLYDPDTDSWWKYFPDIYRKIHRPTSTLRHSMLKLWLIAVTILILIIELNFFLRVNQIVNAFLIWLLLLSTWSAFDVYSTKVLSK